jgi:glycosyltransferase involved in cell wall biosynthesis
LSDISPGTLPPPSDPLPPLRLVQAMAGARHGGAEAFFERLAVGLHHAGVTQQLVIRRNPERTARLRQAGLAVTELPFGGWADFGTRRGIRRVVQDFRPTHVLTWMNRATRLCPRLDGIPHLARLGGYYDLKYYRHCDGLIGNTLDLVRYFHAGGWPDSKTAYLPNFAGSPQSVTPSASLPGDLTKPPGRLLVAMGRLHPNKGFDTLIRAMAGVPDATLWLLGTGPLAAELQQLAGQCLLDNAHERIRFLGWQDAVSPFLHLADVFVCPSRHEPLGNVILEAWAHDVPVVATASEGPRQLIVPQQNGLLVPVDDAEALAAAIRQMLTDGDLRQRCRAGGQTSYATLFSEAAVVAQYIAFLRAFQSKRKEKP